MSNLALNKPVQASSVVNETYKKENVVDGNLSTQWLSNSVSGSREAWVAIDLGNRYDVSKVKISTSYGCTIFDIDVSLDGFTYNNYQKDLPIALGETKEFIVDIKNVRYLRISKIGSSYVSANIGLSEVEVYGELANIGKHFLKSNNLIYSLDVSNNLVNTTSQIADTDNITQLEYETLGFDNISLIDMTQLGNLESPKSVIYYTDDTTITNPKLKHEYSFNIGTRLLKRG